VNGTDAALARRARDRTPRRDRAAAAEALFQRGREHAAAGRWIDAEADFAALTGELPDDPVPWLNLAHARLQRGAHEAAAEAACRAVALDARSELGLELAAQCLEHTGRLSELVELFESVDMNAIANPDLHLRLGTALARLGRYDGAVAALLGALRRDMRCAAAYAWLGNVFQLMKMPEEARESFRNALAIGRSPVEMSTAIVFTSLEACSWARIPADLAALDQQVVRGEGQPDPFYCLNFPWPRQRQLAAARARADRMFAGIAPLPARAPRRPGDKIRVGFVSSDFHEHATAYLIAELFEQQDAARLRFYAYSYGKDDGSPMRRRIATAFGGRFRDVQQMASAALASQIRCDEIDVLIDLKGYTLFSRNDIFAYRAAPIQVNFLGFPGTLGSAHYDYVIGDRVVSPLAHADGYAEKIAQMPDCYQPNDQQRPVAVSGTRADMGLPQAGFVLCCFNANYKITAAVFDRWCSLLRQIDDAVLWLYVANPQARINLLAEARLRGIDETRLVWAGPVPLAQHLGRMRHADLFLDTLPVNAHTTASDALWAGLPLLTVAGETFASRVAASLLCAAGMPELVAADLDGYERIALDLAADRQRLASLRSRLAEQRERCALFDSARYARGFGDLITRMVERADRGLPPEHLPAIAADPASAR